MNRIRRISLKFTLIYFCACLLPLLLICIFLISNLFDFMNENTQLRLKSNAEYMQKHVVSVLNNIHVVIKSMSSDTKLRSYLQTRHENEFASLMSFMDLYYHSVGYSFNDYYKIYIYSDNPTLNVSPATNNSLEEFYALMPESHRKNLNGTALDFFLISGSSRLRPTLCAYKIQTFSGGKKLIFTVEFDATELIGYKSSADELSNLYDTNGSIIATSCKSDAYKHYDEIGFEGGGSISEVLSREVVEIQDTRFSSYSLGISEVPGSLGSLCPNWTLHYMVPYITLSDNLHRMLSSSMLIILLCIVFSLLLGLWLTHDMTSRIKMLRVKTKRVLDGDFNIAAEVASRDELGELESDLYVMVYYIDTMLEHIQQTNDALLQEQSVREQIQQEMIRAELIALRQQINPHFLFNTLESIRMHLVIKDDIETSEIIWMFSQAYRTMIDIRTEKYTLKNELELIGNYLEVQKYRLNGKFTYHVHVEGGLDNVLLPKLLLQPLVENALQHGLDLKRGKMDIAITVTAEDGILRIRVEDNGRGLTTERLLELHRAMEDENYLPDDFLALRNIHKRILLVSHNRGTMSINSVLGQGTQICLTLPIEQSE